MAQQTADRRRRGVIDIVTVVMLSLTAVLTAWCGFQASKWGGEMSIAFSQASSARVQATNFDGQARDARQFDLTIWASWISATAQREGELAAYIEDRFTPAFQTAYIAWRDDSMAEGSPLERPEYVPAGSVQAAEWTAKADERFQAALENNQRGDNYSLLTVLFALVLFLTAMSQRDAKQWVSRAFLILAGVAGVAAIVIMLTLPIKI